VSTNVGPVSVNRKALLSACAVAGLCAAGMVTLASWPVMDPVTWKPLTPPAWWQFEWLAVLGFWLSALPSFVIFKFDRFFAANEHWRNPVAWSLILLEVLVMCFVIYKLVALATQAAMAQQVAAGDAGNPRA
jgi:hypothetical protein